MKVITEERLKEILSSRVYPEWVIEGLIRNELQECGSIHEENGQIIVDELRPMSDARNLGVKRCLAVFVGYPDCFHIVEQYADTYWSDGEDDWHRDDEFIGWVPCPIYRPKDGA